MYKKKNLIFNLLYLYLIKFYLERKESLQINGARTISNIL